MKVYSILYKIILITLIILLSFSSICFADDISAQKEGPQVEEVEDNSSKMYPTLSNSYKPKVDNSEKFKSIVSSILGVLSTLGIITIIVSIGIIGFTTILGSANEKSFAQEKTIGILIASLLIVFGSSFAKTIISLAEKF